MAGYFNKTRGLVTVSLRNGDSAIVRPKGTLRVTSEQDGSASLHAMVRRGLLVRLKEPAKPPIQSASESTSAVSPLLISPGSPEEVEGPEDSEELEELEERPSMAWVKARLINYAEGMGLEVTSSWTKVEILEAIEESG